MRANGSNPFVLLIDIYVEHILWSRTDLMNCLWKLFCVLFPPVFYPLSFYFKQITCVSCLKVFFFFFFKAESRKSSFFFSKRLVSQRMEKWGERKTFPTKKGQRCLRPWWEQRLSVLPAKLSCPYSLVALLFMARLEGYPERLALGHGILTSPSKKHSQGLMCSTEQMKAMWHNVGRKKWAFLQ